MTDHFQIVRKISYALISGLLLLAFNLPATAQQVPQRKPVTLSTSPKGVPTNTTNDSTAVTQAITISQSAEPLMIEVPVNSTRMLRFETTPRHIRIGTESIADIKQIAGTQRFVLEGKAIGSTNILFLDKDGNVIREADIQVMVNSSGIKAAIKKMMPDDTIDVSAHRGNIFLNGVVKSVGDSEKAFLIASRYVENPTSITNMLKISGSQQVILQVKVAEMARTIKKGLSVNTSVSIPSPIGDLDFSTSNAFTSFTALATGSSSSVLNGFGTSVGPFTFQALESQNLIKTLAEPTLTALSGETASFLSGGEYPFPQGYDSNGNLTFEYREFGIGLDFTPVVISDGKINLAISTQVSSIGENVTIGTNTVPRLLSKRTNTNIDLASGTTLMISGLLKDDINDTVQGFPFLKDIPVLGALFRSSEFQKEQTELVILVTAYLASPTDSERKLSTPTDGFEPASDIDIYLLGRMYRNYSKGEEPFWDDPISGPFGYIMR